MPAASDWLVMIGGHGPRVEVPATTLPEAEAIARTAAPARIEYVANCHGRRRWRSRKAALRAGTGPAWQCGTHYHASALEDATQFGPDDGTLTAA